MPNTRESAILLAAVEAVNWRHAGEPAGLRKGQRVVIFPKELPQLEAVLSSNDPSVDPVDGHSIAYEAILQGRQEFENPPVLLREDSEPVMSDPIMAENTQGWMAISRQVAVGNRRRVLENGDDKMNSSDEDDEEMKPDVLTGMYTSEIDPKQGPRKLSQTEVARQMAIAQAKREQMILSVPRVESPQPDEIPEVVSEVRFTRSGGSSDDDTLEGSEWIWSNTRGLQRRNKAWVWKLAQNAKALPAPEPERKPTPVSSDTEDQADITEDQKRYARHAKKKSAMASRFEDSPATRSRAVAEPSTLVPAVDTPKRGMKAAASPRAPAVQPKGTKVPPPTKEQQAPKHPMETRGQASRAGGLRPGGGSGQTDTRVAQGNPSKT
jgi:hypothetical protein